MTMNKQDLRICEDYLQFRNHLNDLRKVDDLIIKTRKTTVLTATFRSRGSDATKQCQQLGDQISARASYRNELISACLSRTNDLMSQSDLSESRRKTLIFQRRQLQNENNIEEIVRTNTEKAFYERCRDFYTPSQNVSLLKSIKQ
ncbi:unnamed protein product [Rotaria sp. Silwood1]|nr:unnamed protein product [Rotaria sp. Silwood1]CAF5012296.1 unnamed protein product [Rotaria sp. Silwood1]